MLPIQRDARRLVIETSGRLELSLMQLASTIAEKQRCHEVTADHIRAATLSLANGNAGLLASLSEPEDVSHGTRAAG
jgi:hypothetical protein